MPDTALGDVLAESELVDEELARDIRALADLKAKAKSLKDEIDHLEAYLAKSVEKSARTRGDKPGVTIVATVVRGTTDRWDEYVLQTEYPSLWAQCVEEKFSKAKFLEAAKRGLVSKEAFERFHHTTANKPYVKITMFEEQETSNG